MGVTKNGRFTALFVAVSMEKVVINHGRKWGTVPYDYFQTNLHHGQANHGEDWKSGYEPQNTLMTVVRNIIAEKGATLDVCMGFFPYDLK